MRLRLFRRSRRKRARLRVTAVFLIVAILAGLGFYIERQVAQSFLLVAEYTAKIRATEAIYRAIKDYINGRVTYDRLVHVFTDGEGRVAYIRPDYSEIERVVTEANLAIQEELKNFDGQNISLPLGVATGSPLLAGYGPMINVRLFQVGTVKARVVDTIENAGINTQRHLINLSVEAQMRTAVPFTHRDFSISTEIPIASTVIVGRVPPVYLGPIGDRLK